MGVTLSAMIAFAANSILCRAALRPDESSELMIDPATYTSIRIVAGALVLWLIQQCRRRRKTAAVPFSLKQLLAPLMLSVYAVGFSFAYIGLDAASGTLILFACVQVTMILIGVMRKEIPKPLEIAGLLVASAGLYYLVAPHIQTPLFKESFLMAVAGIAWGVYSVLGKGSADPIRDTARNFLAGVPVVLLVSCLWMASFHVSTKGILLAALSGGLASGIGYVLWYTVLPKLRSTQAAAVQLSVPILAATGGVLLVGEALPPRTLIAGTAILTGIALTIRWKR